VNLVIVQAVSIMDHVLKDLASASVGKTTLKLSAIGVLMDLPDFLNANHAIVMSMELSVKFAS